MLETEWKRRRVVMVAVEGEAVNWIEEATVYYYYYHHTHRERLRNCSFSNMCGLFQ